MREWLQMIDREYGEINWGLIIVLILCVYYWYSVYWYGFLIPTIITIVIAAIIGICFKMWDMRI